MQRSILLVDDEEIILHSLGVDLRREKYSVTTAKSGEEAIRLLQTTCFDLIITDLSMSALNGIAVLKEAKKRHPQTSVIILTGYGDMSSAIEALRLGADDYVLKPCDTEELIIRIERCMEKQDLVEQFRVQNRKLAESTNQKTMLLNCAAEGIYGIDLQGRTTFMNPAAEKMLGYSEAEIIGKNNHTLIHHTCSDGSPYPKSACRMLEAIKQNRTLFTTGEVLWRKDGTSFPVEYSSAPTQFNDQVTGAVIIFTDITERKIQEKKQRQMEEYLQQLHKHQSLNSMAAGIAHNFNNILMAVIGNQELALANMPKKQKERRFIESAFHASQRAAKLSTMMLQFIGQTRAEIQQIEGSELMNGMAEILRPQIQPQIELCCESDSKITLVGDMTMIRQAIINLVTNASEAIGKGKGNIVLQHGLRFFAADELKHPHMQHTLPAGEYIFISVNDNGPGMDKIVLSKAFDPFFTTKFTGRGMGLATVLGTMRTHGGTALLESLPGKGTTATLLFPARLLAKVPCAADKPATESDVPEISGTLLLVDDDQMVRELGQTFLSSLGFNVLLANDGLEALDLFEKNKDAIDLILLDIAMPHLSGHETLNRIRESSMVPVIMTTGHSLNEIASQYENIPKVSLMQKPFSLEKLKDTILENISPAGSTERQ